MPVAPVASIEANAIPSFFNSNFAFEKSVQSPLGFSLSAGVSVDGLLDCSNFEEYIAQS